VLAAITGVLGELGISIASFVQPERHASEAVPVVILTHRAREAALRRAVTRIEALDEVRERAQLVRIEREI
jgi:homoserine dehydrogenase